MHQIAVVSVNQHKYSETFIHNHVRHLPAKVYYLFNGYLPQQYSTDGVEGKAHSFSTGHILHRLSGTFSTKHLQQSVVKHLRKHHIQVVLAEYGPSGVEMMPVCQQADVPLIVHFHGYDAYRQDIMQTYGKHYSATIQTGGGGDCRFKTHAPKVNRLGLPSRKDYPYRLRL